MESEVEVEVKTLKAKDVADAISRVFSKDPESSFYWAISCKPERRSEPDWPQDPRTVLTIMATEGTSEGSLMRIMYQIPDVDFTWKEIVCVKLLCSIKHIAHDYRTLDSFLEKLDYQKALNEEFPTYEECVQ